MLPNNKSLYAFDSTIIEYPSTYTICLSVMVKLWKVDHIQLPPSSKYPIQFDNKQQVHTI